MGGNKLKKHIIATLVGVYIFSSTNIAYANQDLIGSTAKTAVTSTTTDLINIISTTTNEKSSEIAKNDKIIKITVVSEQKVKEIAGVLPVTIIYKLERTIESLKLVMAISEEKLGTLKSQYALERAAEAAVLTGKGKVEMADKATEEYIEALSSAAVHLNKAIESKDEEVETMKELTEAFASSKTILQIVLVNSPENVKKAVEEVLKNQGEKILAIQGFYAAKIALIAAKKELKAALESGNEEEIKIAEVKLVLAEVNKYEMEALKDASEKSKEEVKALTEETEGLIDNSTKHLEKADEKIGKLSEPRGKEIKEDNKNKEEEKRFKNDKHDDDRG
jgi:hypothetical protein